MINLYEFLPLKQRLNLLLNDLHFKKLPNLKIADTFLFE